MEAFIKATKQILQLLKENKTIGVFPEGTRNKNEEDKFEAKNGACMFAIKSKTPIVPLWLVRKPKPFRKNILLIGEPFELSEFYNERLSQEVLNKASIVLTEKMLELKKAYEQQVLEKQIVKEMKKNKK
jgi:1-acyl-sn-glycerol-3-phosphate acyltransferase